MQITIMRVLMGYSTIHDRKGIQRYPEKCIECVLVFPDVKPEKEPIIYELKFRGNVNNSKGKQVWEFEIITEFQIDRTLNTNFGSDQEEVDNFLKVAYERATLVFDNFVAGSSDVDGRVLCPPGNDKLDISMFK